VNCVSSHCKLWTRSSQLAEALWDANGWRRLGYVTDAQYASERLGMAISSVNDKRLLVRELRRLPHLAKAVHDHAVGYEAARVVAGVATAATDAAWTQRAIERTLVHLREDVAAAEHLARVGQCSVIAPPEPDTVTAWLVLRSCVVTGAVRGFMSNSSRCASPYGGAIAFLPLIARQRLCARRR
jgi:hypothetical protein